MIHTTEDFFNKVATEIRQTYFPNTEFYRDNPECEKAVYATELFNNGCLTYQQFIERLSRYCKDNSHNLHSIVEKYITSFGSYTPQFKLLI